MRESGVKEVGMALVPKLRGCTGDMDTAWIGRSDGVQLENATGVASAHPGSNVGTLLAGRRRLRGELGSLLFASPNPSIAVGNKSFFGARTESMNASSRGDICRTRHSRYGFHCRQCVSNNILALI